MRGHLSDVGCGMDYLIAVTRLQSSEQKNSPLSSLDSALVTFHVWPTVKLK